MTTRKWILGTAALTAAIVVFSGCFGVPSPRRETPSSAPQSVVSASSVSRTPAAEIREVAVGDTITTANLEVTLGYAMFTNRVDSREGRDIISYVWQSADEGKILLDVSVHIKNLQQTTFTGTDVLTITADYDNGYLYDNVVEAVDRAGSLEPTSSFMGTSVKIDPLETVEVRYVIDCPQEVAENTEAPLFLNITVEGVKYRLTMR